jgi:hypothetical protein
MSNSLPETKSSIPTAGRSPGRAWAVVGIVAAIGSFVSVFLSMMLSPAYEAGSVITPEQISAELVEKQPILIAFHIVTLGSGLLLVVFAAGLHRRLREALPAGALAPVVALSGLLLVSVAQVLGSGLDTEFLFGVGDTAIMLPSDIGFYSHWIATIPWLWVGGGLAAVTVGVAWRGGGVPAWIGVTSFILGGLTLLLALSPLQYMAAGPGALWLLLASAGFALGDRRAR